MADIVYECLYGDTYERFIKEAVKRSDLVSVQVYWPQAEFSFLDKNDYINNGLPEEFYVRMYKSRKHKFSKEKSVFEKSTVDFLKELEPFFCSGQTVSDKHLTYFLCATDELIPILLKPYSLDNWGYPYYPENLGFIKNNEYWFYCTNHGTSNATLCSNDENDYAFWKETIGIDFLEEFNKTNDVDKRLPVNKM